MADLDLGAEVSQAPRTWGSASIGTNARRAHRPAAATTAAASAAFPALAMARRGTVLASERPRSSEDLEVEQHADQVSAFVRAGDVARLVLHLHAAVRAESERVGQVPVAAKRRWLKAVAVDVGDLGIEAADELDERLVGDPPARAR